MMSTPADKELRATLIDDDAEFTLEALCESCAVEVQVVVQMVEYGILEPCGADLHEWCFSADSLQRVSTAVRLQRDLGVNMAGAALALDLLDELVVLRRK